MRQVMCFFFILLLSFASVVNAQNLIMNPSFELQHCCPDGYSQFHCTKHWSKPTKGTSDYYSGCENRFYSPEVKVPSNFFGHQNAYKGIGYAGFYAFYEDSYREYVQAKLTQPLKAGTRYHLSFQVSLADTVGLAIKTLGISFSDTICREQHYFKMIRPHQNLALDTGYLNSKEEWLELSTTFTAKGGERFLIIGNFEDNEHTDTISAVTQSTANIDRFVAYYYLDEVCLGAFKPDSTCTCINNGKPPIVKNNYKELNIITTTKK